MVLVLLVAAGASAVYNRQLNPGPAAIGCVAPEPAQPPVVVSTGPGTAHLEKALSQLGGRPVPESSRAMLRELQGHFLAMPSGEAVIVIRDFMASGADRATGMEFGINCQRGLTGWPTMRTFLLDLLFTIDPAASASLGREILSVPTTPDEWSLALRNIALDGNAAQGTADYLRSKTEELIANPRWQADPSVGYLNAFDVLVHVGAVASMPLLSTLIQKKDREDLSHAGFLTLDRLVQRRPAETLARLAADQALQASRPEMVAQEFARADLRDAVQREVVEAWLVSPARNQGDLRAFAGCYPNNNHFISNNLLTTGLPVSGADLARHDREVFAIVTAWRDDAAFLHLRPYLDTVLLRLQQFQSSRGTTATVSGGP